MSPLIHSQRPLLALAFPLGCALLVLLFRSRPNIREGCTLAAAVAQFAVIISMAPIILDGLD